MPTKLYINTKSPSPRTALVRSVTSLVPLRAPDFVLGDIPEFEIYLVDGDGGYDSRSGSGSYAVRMAIGTESAAPTSGTYTLSYNGSTTGAIAYNATAAQVETALELLPTVGNNNVQVTGAFPSYQVEFIGALANGNRPLITGDPDNLLPASTVSVIELRAGTGSVNELQLIRLLESPLAYQETFGAIANGWSGELDCRTFSLARAMGGESEITRTLEVEIEEIATGNRQTVLQAPVRVRGEIIDPDSQVPTPLPDFPSVGDLVSGYIANQSTLTALTGGVASLDSIDTVNLTAGVMVAIRASGKEYLYRLTAGTDAENSPLVIRPDDYAASTNEKVWKLYLPTVHRVNLPTVGASTTEGDVWFDSGQLALQAYLRGIEQTLSGAIFSQGSTRLITNTSAESSLFASGVGSLTLPANFFTGGKTIRVKMFGHYTVSAIAPTMTYKVKLGSTVLATSAAIQVTDETDEGIMIEALINCRAPGASGSFFAQGSIVLGDGQQFAILSTAAVTVDTTVSQVLGMTVTPGSADATSELSITNAIVEVLS